MPLLAALPAIIAIGGGIASSAIGSNAASSAASTQANAANSAAQLQHQDAQSALDFQKQVYGDQQRNSLPFLQTGQGASMSLANLMGIRLPSSTAMTTLPTSQTTLNPNFRVPQLSPGGARAFLSDGSNGPMLASAMSTVANNGGSAFVPRQGASLLNPGGGLNLSGEGATPGSPMSPGSGAISTGPILASTGNNPTGGSATTANGSPLQVPALPTDPANFGSLTQPFGETFTAPTDVTEQNDPGYKFRLAQGEQALQQSAAARGGLLTGGTAKALNDYAQNDASNEYGNVYGRSLGEYQQRYNIYNNDQNTLFNRLSTLAGTGQTTAANLNSAGSQAANTNANTLLTSGQQISNDLNNAAAARGSGYVGSANAINGGIGTVANGLSSLAALFNKSSGGSGSGNSTFDPFGGDFSA